MKQILQIKNGKLINEHNSDLLEGKINLKEDIPTHKELNELILGDTQNITSLHDEKTPCHFVYNQREGYEERRLRTWVSMIKLV